MLVEIRADYDFKDEKVLHFVLNAMTILHKKRLRRIFVRRSSGNHFHIQYHLWLPDEFNRLNNMSFLVGLRLGFADDMGRCIHDIFRDEVGLSTDKLFAAKGDLKNGILKLKEVGKWELVYSNLNKIPRMKKEDIPKTSISNIPSVKQGRVMIE